MVPADKNPTGLKEEWLAWQKARWQGSFRAGVCPRLPPFRSVTQPTCEADLDRVSKSGVLSRHPKGTVPGPHRLAFGKEEGKVVGLEI